VSADSKDLATADHSAHGAVDIPHTPRRADTDVKAARRAERQVAALFGLSALSTLGFVVAYVAFPSDQIVTVPVIGATSASNLFLGLALGIALFSIGAGAIHWAKKLMPDVEEVGPRTPIGSEPDETARAAELFDEGADASGFVSRPIIRRSLLTALVVLPIPAVVLLRDLGPLPETQLRNTIWADGVRVVSDVSYLPIKLSDIPLGGMVSAVPENLPEVEEETGTLNARAKAAVIVVRMLPSEIRTQQNDDWSVDGVLAFSKICTHVGCPIGLYEQQTHHLLCPCHQSTFDLADSGNVVFGPAARQLPQLAIAVDEDGYLVARGDFAEPVGPSFWERG
jgi:ubiquinol-cytochrome c reductase iron-sulfur subunit